MRIKSIKRKINFNLKKNNESTSNSVVRKTTKNVYYVRINYVLSIYKRFKVLINNFFW